jgi:hypothetical protein
LARHFARLAAAARLTLTASRARKRSSNNGVPNTEPAAFAAQSNGLSSAGWRSHPDRAEFGRCGGLCRWARQIIHTAVDNGLAMADVGKIDIAIVSGDNSFIASSRQTHQYLRRRGKTVIVDALTPLHAFQSTKKLNGMDNKGDYNVKRGRDFLSLANLEQDKDSKASMLNPPFSLRAVKSGMKEMGTVAKMLGAYQATGTVVLRSWVRANSDVLVKYMQAYIEGLRWSLDPKNKDEAIKLLADGLKLPQDIASATYAIAVDPAEGLAKDAKFDMEGFTNVLKLRTDWTGVAPGAPEKYLDLSYYQKALAGL